MPIAQNNIPLRGRVLVDPRRKREERFELRLSHSGQHGEIRVDVPAFGIVARQKPHGSFIERRLALGFDAGEFHEALQHGVAVVSLGLEGLAEMQKDFRIAGGLRRPRARPARKADLSGCIQRQRAQQGGRPRSARPVRAAHQFFRIAVPLIEAPHHVQAPGEELLARGIGFGKGGVIRQELTEVFLQQFAEERGRVGGARAGQFAPVHLGGGSARNGRVVAA